MVCSNILIVFGLVLLFIIVLAGVSPTPQPISPVHEGFNPPVNSGYNACASPCSVLPPQWIGRLDQGNGLLGDGPLSGFNFYSAY